MPIYAVPKPNSLDFRLVTDQSYGKHSLNSMVKHESVTGYPLDNLVHFGEMLLDLQRKKPDQVRVAWKSDIAEAYRILPMHPLWQIKQINTIEGKRYVDRCNTSGGSASGALFIAVNSLVAWIAKRIKGASYLGNYVDDSSSCGLADDTVFYEPYQRSFPRDQVILLSLWDELGIPHKEKKQVYGSPLTVIGINVDANNLSFTLPDEAKVRLMEELKWWCRSGGKERLRRWFQMGSWFNWALNAYPLLQPALNNFYLKLKGRRDSPALIWVNKSIQDDFAWAMRILENSTAVLLLKSLSWGLKDATLLIYCDACPARMGFWYPKMRIGFYSPTLAYQNPELILYFKALCVLSAIYDAHHRSLHRSGGYLVVFTDNSNTVDIFNTLRALPPYNNILKAAVDIITEGDHSLHVLHIPGVENVVADALSRADFQRALNVIPNLKLSTFEPWNWDPKASSSPTFQPPQRTLGVVKC